MRVTKGAPSPEELAALAVALLVTRRTRRPDPPPASVGWRHLARHHALRRPLAAGTDGWRASTWTRGGSL
ncbi:acyl-CoA carboxylase epsilon subunit [Streptosporangium amethystogenes]|uniref:acyl-CoA carboxylase epsilon subunit n=1 Tax=Streptosporangium amethystogenes TaxID=2002 RepID=UPI0012FC5D2B|nr:acyl-CoA carboxylase epsilon subunit [Streptosporangium amethystogenes]